MKRQKFRRLLLLISLLLFPVTLYYLSPVLILQGGFSGIVTGSFLTFAALFLFSLLFGRAFCGWLCPSGGLQECCLPIVDKKVAGKRIDYVKYVLWVPWLVCIVLGFLRAEGIQRIDVFYMTDHGLSVSGVAGYVVYLSVITLITVLALTLGRRGMCHSVCWMAPFMILGTKLKDRLGYPSLHLEADAERCVQCGLCSKRCPMGLDVAEMVRTGQMQNSECILCGSCADHCGKGAVRFAFRHSRQLLGQQRK